MVILGNILGLLALSFQPRSAMGSPALLCKKSTRRRKGGYFLTFRNRPGANSAGRKHPETNRTRTEKRRAGALCRGGRGAFGAYSEGAQAPRTRDAYGRAPGLALTRDTSPLATFDKPAPHEGGSGAGRKHPETNRLRAAASGGATPPLGTCDKPAPHASARRLGSTRRQTGLEREKEGERGAAGGCA